MTKEELQALLNNPLFLFAVMLLGGLCSIGKQMRDAKHNGSDVTIGVYLSHWPELLTALMLLVVAFVGMIESNTLNFVSAWTTGYASNSLADLARPGSGRSADMAVEKESIPQADER